MDGEAKVLSRPGARRGSGRGLRSRWRARAAFGPQIPPSGEAKLPPCGHGGSAALTPWGHSPMGKKNSVQIRPARLHYLSVGLKLKTERSVWSYPSNVPNLMESLDSGHTTVKTENSQPLSRVSVKARTLAHESYCGVVGWLHPISGQKSGQLEDRQLPH